MNKRLICAISCLVGCNAYAAGKLAAPVPSVLPTANSAICKALEAAIDAGEQDVSVEENKQLLEDSAPRATVEAAKIGAAYQAIQANLILMGQHRCAPYEHTITGAYLLAAMKCQTDEMSAVLSRSTTPPESCDRSKWSRTN